MDLQSWLTEQKISHAEFAVRVGATKHAVGKWVRGERMPRPVVMEKIGRITEGQVTANDFMAAHRRAA